MLILLIDTFHVFEYATKIELINILYCHFSYIIV
jgi:hypothetical protein